MNQKALTEGIEVSSVFVGRERELESLRREISSSRPSLIIIFGRRRVGKSALILKALGETPHVYYQATRLLDSANLSRFRDRIRNFMGTDDPLLAGLQSWEAVFEYLIRLARTTARSTPLTVVLDEFPYLCEMNPGLPSILQVIWDQIERERLPLKLVLCGSMMAFMEDLLAERNPLYGRQTMVMKVGPLPFRDGAKFFPGWTDEDRLLAHFVFGGIPYYLGFCSPAKSFSENIVATVFGVGAPLLEEPEHVLQAELRSVSRYASIINAIASGCTQVSQIVGHLRELRSATDLAPYIATLMRLGLIRREASLDQRDRERERKGRYFLNDQFMVFWYRFVLPNLSAIASGHGQEMYETVVAPALNDYGGSLFEVVSRQYMSLYGGEAVASPVREVGRIWGDDSDIDVVGETIEGTPFFGECKWTVRAVGTNVLEELRRRAASTAYGRRASDRYLLLFSKSGFTPELTRIARADPWVRLLDLSALLGRTGPAHSRS